LKNRTNIIGLKKIKEYKTKSGFSSIINLLKENFPVSNNKNLRIFSKYIFQIKKVSRTMIINLSIKILNIDKKLLVL